MEIEIVKLRKKTTPAIWLSRNSYEAPEEFEIGGVPMRRAMICILDLDKFKKVVGDRFRHQSLTASKANYVVEYVG